CGCAAVWIRSSAEWVEGAVPSAGAAGAGAGGVGTGLAVGCAPAGVTGTGPGGTGGVGGIGEGSRGVGSRPPGLGRMIVRSPRPNGLDRPSLSLIVGLP